MFFNFPEMQLIRSIHDTSKICSSPFEYPYFFWADDSISQASPLRFCILQAGGRNGLGMRISKAFSDQQDSTIILLPTTANSLLPSLSVGLLYRHGCLQLHRLSQWRPASCSPECPSRGRNHLCSLHVRCHTYHSFLSLNQGNPNKGKRNSRTSLSHGLYGGYSKFCWCGGELWSIFIGHETSVLLWTNLQRC